MILIRRSRWSFFRLRVTRILISWLLKIRRPRLNVRTGLLMNRRRRRRSVTVIMTQLKKPVTLASVRSRLLTAMLALSLFAFPWALIFMCRRVLALCLKGRPVLLLRVVLEVILRASQLMISRRRRLGRPVKVRKLILFVLMKRVPLILIRLMMSMNRSLAKWRRPLLLGLFLVNRRMGRVLLMVAFGSSSRPLLVSSKLSAPRILLIRLSSSRFRKPVRLSAFR